GKITYRYNGDGQLIARKVGGAETTFIPNPLSFYWQPMVMEAKESGRTLIVWEGATPLIMIRGGKPEYLLHDHLGSVRLVLDPQGQETRRLDYEPFGSIVDSATGTGIAPRFGGLFWDPDAKVY